MGIILKDLWDIFYRNGSITSKALILLPSLFKFSQTYFFLKKSQYWSKNQIDQYQYEKLSKLLVHAYEYVPYYKKLFDQNNLKPEDIRSVSDISKIPILTKEIIRKHFDDIKSTYYPDTAFEYVTTGGSTGIPMGFYYEKGESRAREWAFLKSLWDRIDYHFWDKCVILRGNVINKNVEGKYYEKTLFGRWLLLSSYHMMDDDLRNYCEIIKKFKPKYIQSYPSSITIFAKYMIKNNIPPFKGIRAIICASENLYDWQRELIESAFNCRVFSFYGNSERTVFGGECEFSSTYHISPEYGIFELLGKDNETITNANQNGKIITTGLNNYIFPLIRYETQDIGAYSDKCCSCGRNYKLLDKIEGRLQEFIISKNGRYISMVAINMHSPVFDNVDQFQFYQEEKGVVTFNIVKNKNYSERDSEKILLELLKKMGDDIELNLSFVSSIPRTQSGKYRFLIQKLPVEFGDR